MADVPGQVTAPQTTQTDPAPVTPPDTGVTKEAAQAAFDAFGQQPPAEGDNRQRDEHGRFVSTKPKEEPTTAAAPAAPTIDPIWRQAAKDVYFTDDEITSFKTPELLKTAVTGRRFELAQRHGGQQPRQPAETAPKQPDNKATASPAQSAAEEFKLALPDGMDEEFAAPLKGMAAEINKLRQSYQTLAEEKQQLQQRVEQYETDARQSAQSVQLSQQAQEWDRLVADIPGIVDFMGKPSEAMVRSRLDSIIR